MARQVKAPTVALHPNLPELYRRKVVELEAALNDESIKADAAEILRSLIDKVVLTPDGAAPNRLHAELHGDIASILGLCESGACKQKLSNASALESQLSLVAGACNHRQLSLPPVSI